MQIGMCSRFIIDTSYLHQEMVDFLVDVWEQEGLYEWRSAVYIVYNGWNIRLVQFMMSRGSFTAGDM